MNAVYFGVNAAEALAMEVKKRQSQRVFLLVSGTLNRETNEVRKIRGLLGERYAAEFDQMPQHMPRDAILKAAEVARSAKADLVVTIGGGSVTDAGKTLTVCLEHDIRKLEDFEPFILKVSSDGKLDWPEFRPPSVRQIAIPTTLSGGEFHMGVDRSIQSRRYAKRSAIRLWYPARSSWTQHLRCTLPCGCGFPPA